MGLDNIPRKYACTEINPDKVVWEVRDNGTKYIDCEKTIASGNCPWSNQYQYSVKNDSLMDGAVPSVGMFGTGCWYRGKYGNWLLSLLPTYANVEPFNFDFYGPDGGDEEGLSADDCLALASYMSKHIESFVYAVANYMKDRSDVQNGQTIIKDYIYAIWWLKFVAENCNGSAVWY